MSTHARRTRDRLRLLTGTGLVAGGAGLVFLVASLAVGDDGEPAAKVADPPVHLAPSTSASTSESGSTSAYPSATGRTAKPQRVVEGRTLKRLPAGSLGDPGLRDRTETLLESVEQPATTFRVSTFNLLGAGHTGPRGNKRGYHPGPTRMHWAMGLLQGAGVSVAGLQELEMPQYTTMRRIAPGWQVYPGPNPRTALANSITWRADTWEQVEGHTLAIPYFHGRPKPMPYVLLRHRETGQEVWFANVHNPASTRGPAAAYRRTAVAREAQLARQLTADGTPMIYTGDMNDRGEYYCPMTAQSPLHAARGGFAGTPCRPPAQMGIDWIMGSSDIEFSDHHAIRGGLVARTTDHPFVWSDATIAPQAPQGE